MAFKISESVSQISNARKFAMRYPYEIFKHGLNYLFDSFHLFEIMSAVKASNSTRAMSTFAHKSGTF